MTEGKAEQEPSMEEILASIRRIISEDDKPESAAADDGAKDDVLELTQMVADDGTTVDLTKDQTAAAPDAEAEPQPDIRAAESPAPPDREADAQTIIEVREPSKPRVEAESVVDVAAQAEEEVAEAAEEGLISEAAANASLEAISRLTQSVEREPAARGGGRPLEDLVLEALRPVLREWVDANLPALVERVVEREISKLVRDKTPD